MDARLPPHNRTVGRERELGVASIFLDRAAAGPVVLHVDGEAGIGKTTFWAHALRLAAGRGFSVLEARPSASDTSLPYVGLTDLLRDAYDTSAERLPRPQRKALDAALLRSREDDGAPDQRAVATGFLTVLAVLAARAPVVVAVDDAQWLDPASARVLEFASRRLAAMPIGVVASSRPESGMPAFVRALPDDRVIRLRLGPLRLAALFRIIVDRLGLTLARPILLRVEAASRGNPMFALEIARVLGAEGLPSSGLPLPIPDSLSTLVAEKIRGLPDATQAALLTLAAIGRATSGRLDPDVFAPAVTAGVVAERDGRIEFTHPLFAAAAYARATPAERRRLHAHLANVTVDIVERARHLARSSTEPDAGTAAALLRAADEARNRGAPDLAAELEEQAADRTPVDDPHRRPERWLQAAEHWLQAGDRAHATALARRALGSAAPGRLRSRALGLLGEARLQDSYSDASRWFEEALAAAPDEASEAPLLLDVAFVLIGSGDFAGAERRAVRAVRLGEASGDEAFLAEALAVRTMAHFLATGELDRATLDRAVRLEDVDRQGALWFRPTLVAALLHLYTINLADARRMLGELRDRMCDRGEDTDLPFVLVNLAWVRVLSGDLEGARADVEAALEAAELSAAETMRGFALAMRAVVGAQEGRLEAEADAREALELTQRTGWLVGAQWSMAALASMALSHGRPADAVRALEPLLGPVEAIGRVDFPTGFFVPDAIEALVGVGEIERADRLATALDAQGQRWAWNRALAARSHALVEASRGQLDAALAAAAMALDASASLPIPVERGRALLVRGEILRRTRRKHAAREAIQEALDILDRLGAVGWALKARAELGRIGYRVGARDCLTETERRVAELAAAGLTNREVGARAFLAPKSVESVLERVYAKLGIHSRAELGAMVAAGRSDFDQGRELPR